MGVHDEEELDRLIFAYSRRLHEMLEAGRKEVRDGRGMPNGEFWKQVETERPVTPKRNRGKKKAGTA